MGAGLWRVPPGRERYDGRSLSVESPVFGGLILTQGSAKLSTIVVEIASIPRAYFESALRQRCPISGQAYQRLEKHNSTPRYKRF